ncbi:segregation and condensation protein A [Elusimicrobiota bacterium]
MADIVYTKDKKLGWKVETDSFEGPMDLLLYLIKKNNMDIYDIPIAEITSEYLKYIEFLKQMDLDNVGDFLVMASILMRIKSSTLLPAPDSEEEGEENAEELKRDLIARLIEYKKFKETAVLLKERELQYDGIMPVHQYPLKEFGHSVDVTLFDLIDAFQKLVENATTEVKDIITEEISVDDKIRYVMDLIEKKPQILLKELVGEKYTVMELIVTLLALLELARTRQIRIVQETRFSEISLSRYNEQ